MVRLGVGQQGLAMRGRRSRSEEQSPFGRGVEQFGSAPRSGRGNREFESLCRDQFPFIKPWIAVSILSLSATSPRNHDISLEIFWVTYGGATNGDKLLHSKHFRLTPKPEIA